MDIFFKCWAESVPPLVGGIGRAREPHEFWAEAILNAIWKVYRAPCLLDIFKIKE
jgi:hypothetical protein